VTLEQARMRVKAPPRGATSYAELDVFADGRMTHAIARPASVHPRTRTAAIAAADPSG
jgi:hypothetical protein